MKQAPGYNVSHGITGIFGPAINSIVRRSGMSAAVENLVDSIGDAVIYLRTDLATNAITDAGAGAVSAVADISGNNNHAVMVTAGNRPTIETVGINGLRGIRHAAGDYLDLPNVFSGLTVAEVFLVAKRDVDPPTEANLSGLWDFGTDTQNTALPWIDSNVYDDFGTTIRKNPGNPAASLASPFLYNVVTAAGEWTARVNGTQLYTTSTNTVGFNTAPRFGGSGMTGSGPAVYAFGGYWHELIVFSKKLTAPQRTALNADIATRYGITVV